MKIYLDAMGGDNAPEAPVAGALEALGMYPELEIELAGPIDTVTETVERVFASSPLRSRLTLTDCPEIITNCEAPVMAVRKKKQSAIVDGMLKLRDGLVDAFVSAGSTGAVLAGGMFRLGRIKGIDRPALAPLKSRLQEVRWHIFLTILVEYARCILQRRRQPLALIKRCRQ